MKNIAYYNGKIGPIEEMTVPMNDRACYFADGVYDAMMTRNHIPLSLDDHLARLYRSAKMIDIEVPMPFETLRALMMELCAKVDSPDAMAYVQVTRGVGMRSHPYSGAGEGGPSLWIFVKPDELDDMDREYSCITLPDTRFLHCNIKTINLLPAVIANQRAMEAGCEETIFHRGERVTECSHSNVHIIKDGVLKTAPCDNLILPGITRAHILEICARKGIPVIEEPFTLDEMMDADEIFFSSASAVTSRVCAIDGKNVGMKDEKTFAIIRDTYQQDIKEECR